MIKIVHLEDNQMDATLIRHLLDTTNRKARIVCVDDQEDFCEAVNEMDPDLVISDINVPEFSGFQALEWMVKNHPTIPVIIVTGSLDEETAADTIRSGAWDYVVKERLHRLPSAIERCLQQRSEKELISLAENQLRLLQKAIAHAQAAVIITNSDALIEFVNPKFTELTGYKSSEVIGKNPGILKSGHHTSEFYQEMWASILDKGSWKGEIRNKKKDGTLYWETVSIARVRNEEGKTSHFIGIKDDITQQKRIQEEKDKVSQELLIAKEKAEESDRLKSAFLANISHEIRTPLNAIIGYSDLVVETDNTDDEQEEYTAMIQTGCEQLISIVGNMMHISLIEAGQITITPSEFNLKKYVEQQFSNAKILKKKEQVELFLEPVPDLPMFTDQGRLSMIITNLLENAIKFTGKGEIRMTVQNKDDQIMFSIQDTGKGIDENIGDHIFERFYRNDDPAHVSRGSGLGLSICKSYVETLGGQIWYHSRVNEGSTFYFSIPQSYESI